MPSKHKKPHVIKAPERGLKTLDQIADEMNQPGNIRVGLPANSNPYPDGTSVIMVGAVQEFGSLTRNIPQRSYLRSTITEKRRQYKGFLRQLALRIGRGKLTAKKALSLMGLKLQGDVQRKVRTLRTPPLQPETIAEKGSTNPLIDTGHLRQSIVWVVNKDDDSG